ncbi:MULTISPECIES: hypothetical protein [Calothrix]|uniref:Uncharacterized protein n=2 Tax=Calothrix TaxID=1186 RepID=A0ABR8AG10_9CYAN|nr:MULTISPECIES: hypothetical protein [Calothrix]MBD2198977.1 hypothetical protein [Calothrix parietina FACHB-288]MBD2227679.1 hypothetical protein [Calothrix anomala FACHB-343]
MIYLLLALLSGLAWWLISLIIPIPIALVVVPLLVFLLAIISSAVEPEEEENIQANPQEKQRVK